MNSKLVDAARYRYLVGELIYFTVIGPDIAYSVGVVSQFIQKPQKSHLEVVIRILQYIKGTHKNDLIYKRNEYTKIQGYANADFVGIVDDRQLVTRFCTYAGEI